MPIRVKCESCKKTLGVKDEHAGKKIKCPVCQNVVAIPGANGQNGTHAPQPANAVAKKSAAAKPSPDGKKPVPDAKRASAEIKKATPAPAAPEQNGPPPEHVDDEAMSVFAEDLASKEADEAPKTIDFVCEWCETEVHLPIDMAGKQTQCPNPECRRIVKVPLPKIQAKKDWKKMDRRGPAAALVNQPEQLENAWGTQEATKARQASLAQAGVIELPPKPPIGAAGWIMRGVYGVCIAGVLGAATFGILRLRESNGQEDAIADINRILAEKVKVGENDQFKFTDFVCRAKGMQTVGMYRLFSKEGKAAKAQESFSGAQSLVIHAEGDEVQQSVNEQMFLADLALAQLEMGGSAVKEVREDEIIRKLRLPWEDVQGAVKATLLSIKDPECQVIAIREVATRLLAKNQEPIAVGLIAHVIPAAGDSPVVSQKIALDYLRGDEETTKKTKELQAGMEGEEPYYRVGCAEGCARKGEFDEAFKLAEKGAPQDRLAAYIGVAAVIVSSADPAQKDQATRFVKEALKLAPAARDSMSPWQLLLLVKLASRSLEPAGESEDGAALKNIANGLKGQFRRRAELEIFIAKCDRSAVPIDPKELEPLESLPKDAPNPAAKDAKQAPDTSTLPLAWFALARQHARAGQKRAQVQKAVTDKLAEDQAMMEKVRPMVDIGWYLGAVR